MTAAEHWFELLSDPQAWVSFVVLAALEIVLGIDNLLFLTLAVERLPAPARPRARLVGLSLAMLTRVGLLIGVVGLTRLVRPLFLVGGFAVSLRDLVLLTGGAFLIASSVRELIADRRQRHAAVRRAPGGRFWPVMLEVALIDILFSFDSVFGAVGLASQVEVMIAAILVSLPVMMGIAAVLGRIIQRHPSVKVLALGFLAVVGLYLGAQGLHLEPPRVYLYGALGLAALVEAGILLLRARP